MSLKDTYKQMRELLTNITADLEKSENGNKAASQRVRTGTVRLEKVAKLYRKESIASEKKNKGQKKAAPKKAAPKKAAAKPKAAASKSKSAAVKAKPKAKATHHKASASVRPRQLSVRRATAKLPARRAAR